MRKNHSDEFKALWQRNRFNRFPLLFTVLVRYVLSSAFIFNVIHYLFSFSAVAQWIVSFVLMLVIIASRRVKLNSVRLEHLFLRNLHSREIQAEQQGRTAPGYAQRLLSRDIHLSILTLPMNTRLAGQTLFSLDLARKDGVMVAAIIREGARINIPGGNMRLFPGDKLQVIGDDEHLSAFARRLQTEINTAYERTDDHEMLLRSLTIDASLPFCNKTVRESRLREDYQCMLVGFEDGEEHLGLPHADRLIREGDVIWIVGERASLQSLTSQI